MKEIKIDMLPHDEFQCDLLADDVDNMEVTGFIPEESDSDSTQLKDISLLIIELKDIIIKLLRQENHLLHFQKDKLNESIMSKLEKHTFEISDGIKHEDKIMDGQKVSEVDIMRVVEETINRFLEYLLACKRCLIFIEKVHKADGKELISDISTSIENLSNSVSKFKEHFFPCSASVRVFDKCESLLEHDLEITNDNFMNMIDSFLTAIEDLTFSYRELESVLVNFIHC